MIRSRSAVMSPRQASLLGVAKTEILYQSSDSHSKIRLLVEHPVKAVTAKQPLDIFLRPVANYDVSPNIK